MRRHNDSRKPQATLTGFRAAIVDRNNSANRLPIRRPRSHDPRSGKLHNGEFARYFDIVHDPNAHSDHISQSGRVTGDNRTGRIRSRLRRRSPTHSRARIERKSRRRFVDNVVYVVLNGRDVDDVRDEYELSDYVDGGDDDDDGGGATADSSKLRYYYRFEYDPFDVR